MTSSEPKILSRREIYASPWVKLIEKKVDNLENLPHEVSLSLDSKSHLLAFRPSNLS